MYETLIEPVVTQDARQTLTKTMEEMLGVFESIKY